MEIKTKFAIGDKLWRLSENKAKSFEVRHIAYDGAVYYGTSAYDLSIETVCFATKEELIEYISADE